MPEVPLRATNACRAQKQMMGSFRLDPFAMHNGVKLGPGGQSGGMTNGEGSTGGLPEPGPLEEEPQTFEWLVELDGNGYGHSENEGVGVGHSGSGYGDERLSSEVMGMRMSMGGMGVGMSPAMGMGMAGMSAGVDGGAGVGAWGMPTMSEGEHVQGPRTAVMWRMDEDEDHFSTVESEVDSSMHHHQQQQQQQQHGGSAYAESYDHNSHSSRWSGAAGMHHSAHTSTAVTANAHGASASASGGEYTFMTPAQGVDWRMRFNHTQPHHYPHSSHHQQQQQQQHHSSTNANSGAAGSHAVQQQRTWFPAFLSSEDRIAHYPLPPLSHSSLV